MSEHQVLSMVDEEEGYRKIRRMPSRCLGTAGLLQNREVICGTKSKHQGTGAVYPFGFSLFISPE
ncbi:hypothetical protein [Desulfitobacterium dichloroeliminans]|uniref:hypothetical protein n=1 Tax=Desulfitobacterium dichloroeliminans TaxID=233055 RepID=UPI0012EACC32|nr:hypothetical protein [Desulfitobacterium dichloroeliminans]